MWDDYWKYKKTGNAGFKAPWVIKFWDSIDFSEEQYNLAKKCEDRLVLVCVIGGIFIGMAIDKILRGII